MKKFSEFIASALAVSIVFSGCSLKTATESSEAPAEESSQSEEAAEAPTEAQPVTQPLPDVEKLEPAEGVYVYDNAGILTSEDVAALNSYAEHLYENYLINAAVVTASELGGKSPYDYADEAYTEIYGGRGSGLLLLINNDTNVDQLYKTGSCGVFIDRGAEQLAFFWATKEIVAGDYRSAALRLLQLGESCPQHVFDNGGVFSADEIGSLETTLSGCHKDISLLATSNSTGSSNEEICRSYCDRRYKDGGGYMIMLDTESKSAVVVSDEALPSGLDKALAEAEKSAKTGDYHAAAETVIAVIEG